MQDPYKYFFDENSETYRFETKNNIVYSVAFLVDETLNSVSTSGFVFDNIYQIIIEKITDTLEPLDTRVFSTIDLIISVFFKTIENALIYVCSTDNNKELKRLNVFNRWYQNSQHREYINKIDNALKFTETSTIVYTSILYHNNNPNVKYIVETFNQIEETINKP